VVSSVSRWLSKQVTLHSELLGIDASRSGSDFQHKNLCGISFPSRGSAAQLKLDAICAGWRTPPFSMMEADSVAPSRVKRMMASWIRVSVPGGFGFAKIHCAAGASSSRAQSE
jgi:hypothetical protein